MTIKRILVLANSTKHHPRSCVAGRELIEEGNCKTRWGGWIRPVSNHDEGALDFTERRLAESKDPKPLDMIQLSLSAPENNPLQPENWLIQEGQAWTKESSYDVEALLPLVEEPDNLWLDVSQKIDRASAIALQRLPNFQSLYLIRPQTFYFQIRSRVWDGDAKKQQRGVFTYKGRQYDFALTDPLIGRKYFPDYPRTQEGIIEPKDSNRILLCVSLTPPFLELHYKVIATVFELPA
jgi:putative nucleic acid modification protein with dual OB domain